MHLAIEPCFVALFGVLGACGGSTAPWLGDASADTASPEVHADAGSAETGHTTWYDAGGDLPGCKQAGAAIDYEGDRTFPPGSLPSGACSAPEACNASIAIGPYCGNEAIGLTNYTCECLAGAWRCEECCVAGGAASKNFCDGGPGSLNPP